MVLPEEYKLRYLAQKYGIRKILLTPDWWPALIITIIVTYYYIPNFKENANSISLTLIGADAGLLGIVLAGFAIMISLMHGDFKDILKEAGLYDDTVFLFCYDSLLIGIGLIFSIFFSLALPIDITISRWLFAGSIFFSTYGLFSVVWLLFHLKDLAMLKGEMTERKN